MRHRLLPVAKRFAAHQVDRARVFLSRTVLELKPSPEVDYHTLRILLSHLRPRDVSFLERAFGSTTVDLDDVRETEGPSFFSRILWVLALDGLWPRSSTRRVEYRVGAASFAMDLDLSLAPECTYYVEDPTPSLTRLLRLGSSVFYDVGANVGFHTLTAALFFEESHGFEPTPSTLTRLHANASLNPKNPIKIHGVALSSQDGLVTLKVSKTHPGGNEVVSKAESEGDTVEVPSYRLDSYCRRNPALRPPELIKIDVEGHEMEVLAGALETVGTHRPSLFVELLSTQRFRDFSSRLPEGYAAYSLKAKGAPVLIDDDSVLNGSGDVLFVDASKQAIIQRLQSMV